MQTIAQLEDQLSEPTPGVIETMRRLQGDIMVLGVAGKMGPTLARMALRASQIAGVKRKIIGVSRFSSSDQKRMLEEQGIETISCDLLNEEAVQKLPEIPNIVYMAGMKFGSTGNESATWAMNACMPGVICRKFHHSKIVTFSTGNIYGMVPIFSGGSKETDPLNPIGEYAMSCLGRERVSEHFSRELKIPISIIRLNYACELRYGVLVDLAQRIQADQPIDVTMGSFNIIWQADANAMALQSFDHAASPPFVINVTGPEQLGVHDVAEKLAAHMGIPVNFTGQESTTALLSNASQAIKLFGPPRITADQLIEKVADWIKNGGATLNKPTHFESRDGRF